MLDDLKPLALFARVIELGSFRAVARAEGLSASVVSLHVSELEKRLGVPLLYRSTRRLALTPDGESLLAPARTMIDAAQRGIDLVSGRSAAPGGVLRLTAPAFFAETPFPRHVAAFMRAYPRVQLSMSFSEAPRDLLRDGLDVALRIGRLEDSALKVKKVAEMHRVLVAAPKYAAARRPPRRPADLAAWDFIRLTSRPAEVTLASEARGVSATVKFEGRASTDSAAAMRALVLEGAGVAALPEVMVRGALASGAAVEPLPGWRPTGLSVYAVRPHAAAVSGVAQLFVDFVGPKLAQLFQRDGAH